MKVLRHRQDQGLVLGNALCLVAPLSRNLDGRLDGLCARVHGQDHVEAKRLGDDLGKARKDIIVKGSRAQGQGAGLVDEGLDELGVAVALVDGAVGRQKVEIVLALGVPDVAALGLAEDDGQRVVVVGGVLVLGLDALVGRGVDAVCAILVAVGVAVGVVVGVV